MKETRTNHAQVKSTELPTFRDFSALWKKLARIYNLEKLKQTSGQQKLFITLMYLEDITEELTPIEKIDSLNACSDLTQQMKRHLEIFNQIESLQEPSDNLIEDLQNCFENNLINLAEASLAYMDILRGIVSTDTKSKMEPFAKNLRDVISPSSSATCPAGP
jgi:hypothetical protein